MSRSSMYRRAKEVSNIKIRNKRIVNDQNISKIYSNCLGVFGYCPDSIADPKSPPESCKKCIQFQESKYNERKIDQTRLELWKKMMEK